MRGMRGRSASCASRVSPRGSQALSIIAHWHRLPELEAVPPAPHPDHSAQNLKHTSPFPAHHHRISPRWARSSCFRQLISVTASVSREKDSSQWAELFTWGNTVFNSAINHFKVLTQAGFYHHSHVPLSRLGEVHLSIRERGTWVILTDATQMTDTDGWVTRGLWLDGW